MDNILHYPSTFTTEHAKMEEADLDSMIVHSRFVATERVDGENHTNSPWKLQLEMEGHHQGYCRLIADGRIFTEATTSGRFCII